MFSFSFVSRNFLISSLISLVIQNLWDAAKAIPRGEFVAIQSYLKKQEKSHIDNLSLLLKQVEKEEQTKPKVSKKKEIIKIKAEINEVNEENDRKV